jgi:hypothetical protein
MMALAQCKRGRKQKGDNNVGKWNNSSKNRCSKTTVKNLMN